MKTFVRIVFFILFTLNSIWAQQIQVSVQPQNPVVNQPFQISYDISGAGFRIWGGATVEASDIETLLPWIEWGYESIKS